MTRPRAADDFATIRARMEKLRRERARAFNKDPRDRDGAVLGGRGLPLETDAPPRREQRPWLEGSTGRRQESRR